MVWPYPNQFSETNGRDFYKLRSHRHYFRMVPYSFTESKRKQTWKERCACGVQMKCEYAFNKLWSKAPICKRIYYDANGNTVTFKDISDGSNIGKKTYTDVTDVKQINVVI